MNTTTTTCTCSGCTAAEKRAVRSERPLRTSLSLTDAELAALSGARTRRSGTVTSGSRRRAAAWTA